MITQISSGLLEVSIELQDVGDALITSSELLLRGPPAKTASRRPTMRNDLGAQRQANPQTPHKRSPLRDSQKRRAGRADPKKEIDPPFCQFWGGAEMHRGEEDSWKGSTSCEL